MNAIGIILTIFLLGLGILWAHELNPFRDPVLKDLKWKVRYYTRKVKQTEKENDKILDRLDKGDMPPELWNNLHDELTHSNKIYKENLKKHKELLRKYKKHKGGLK